MKKGLLIFAGIVLAACIYLFTLDNTFESEFTTDIPIFATERQLLDTKQWTKWWHGKKYSDSTYHLGNRPVKIRNFLATNFKIWDDNTSATTSVSFIQVSQTKTAFTFRGSYPLSKNIFTRINQYRDLNNWKNEQKKLVEKMRSFFSSIPSMYGFNIEMKKVLNSPHISMVSEFDHKPSNEEVYQMFDQIQQYVESLQHKTKDHPIMNIFAEDGKYRVMTAYATDTILPSFGPFQLKQMVLGNILIAEVKGGHSTIDRCMQQVDQYVKDYGKSSPAIPFQRWITNRRKETDSTKWITTVNYPVFE